MDGSTNLMTYVQLYTIHDNVISITDRWGTHSSMRRLQDNTDDYKTNPWYLAGKTHNLQMQTIMQQAQKMMSTNVEQQPNE